VVVPVVAHARPTSHVLLQQASPVLPHGHRPPWQVPMEVVPDRHCEPLATQRLLKQQASPAHCPPVQQASPTCPQRAQIASLAVDEQAEPGSHWLRPAQHVTPCLPHAAQKPERQARPC